MEINDVFGYLEHHPADEIISEGDLATLKNLANDYLDNLPLNQFEKRWQVMVAVLLAKMHFPGVDEKMLVMEFEAIKKMFLNLETSMWVQLKNLDEPNRKIINFQLSYFYKLFESYLSRIKEIAEKKGFHELLEKIAKQATLMHVRLLLHSGKTEAVVSAALPNVPKNVDMNKMLVFRLTVIIFGGILAIHGAVGIFNLYKISPWVTLIAGMVILVGANIFFRKWEKK